MSDRSVDDQIVGPLVVAYRVSRDDAEPTADRHGAPQRRSQGTLQSTDRMTGGALRQGRGRPAAEQRG